MIFGMNKANSIPIKRQEKLDSLHTVPIPKSMKVALSEMSAAGVDIHEMARREFSKLISKWLSMKQIS